MEAQQFAYWLQGFAELSGDAPPTPEQWKSIREHLAAVFRKVTPPVDLTNPIAVPYIMPQKWLNTGTPTLPPATVECMATKFHPALSQWARADADGFVIVAEGWGGH